MSPEAALLAGLASDPCLEGWLVLADYWDEIGDRRGELTRLLHDPARIASLTDDDRSDRILALWNAGVGPVRATMTDAVGIEYAWIPPGTSRMGGNGVEDNPERRVTITRGFFMGVHPVTQQQYFAVTGESPSRFAGDDRPVEMVSWDDAVIFCERLNATTGRAIRLPTEAEWEYACRAGTTTEFWSGNDEAAFEKVGWGEWNSGFELHAVGDHSAPNHWGLHDMHGNVWEWCQDVFFGASRKKTRVQRGGAFYDDHWNALSAFRQMNSHSDRYSGFGFRVCYRPE